MRRDHWMDRLAARVGIKPEIVEQLVWIVVGTACVGIIAWATTT